MSDQLSYARYTPLSVGLCKFVYSSLGLDVMYPDFGTLAGECLIVTLNGTRTGNSTLLSGKPVTVALMPEHDFL